MVGSHFGPFYGRAKKSMCWLFFQKYFCDDWYKYMWRRGGKYAVELVELSQIATCVQGSDESITGFVFRRIYHWEGEEKRIYHRFCRLFNRVTTVSRQILKLIFVCTDRHWFVSSTLSCAQLITQKARTRDNMSYIGIEAMLHWMQNGGTIWGGGGERQVRRIDNG